MRISVTLFILLAALSVSCVYAEDDYDWFGSNTADKSKSEKKTEEKKPSDNSSDWDPFATEAPQKTETEDKKKEEKKESASDDGFDWGVNDSASKTDSEKKPEKTEEESEKTETKEKEDSFDWGTDNADAETTKETSPVEDKKTEPEKKSETADDFFGTTEESPETKKEDKPVSAPEQADKVDTSEKIEEVEAVKENTPEKMKDAKEVTEAEAFPPEDEEKPKDEIDKPAEEVEENTDTAADKNTTPEALEETAIEETTEKDTTETDDAKVQDITADTPVTEEPKEAVEGQDDIEKAAIPVEATESVQEPDSTQTIEEKADSIDDAAIGAEAVTVEKIPDTKPESSPVETTEIKEKADKIASEKKIQVAVESENIAGNVADITDKSIENAALADEKVSKKTIKTGEPVSKESAYRYSKEIVEKAENTATPPTVKKQPENKYSSEELAEIARQLENPLLEQADSAKESLISAGSDGAKAACPYLSSNRKITKIQAILIIRKVADKTVAEKLLPLLSDESPTVRYHANLALKSVYNQDFNYFHNASLQERTTAIKRWEQYISTNLSEKHGVTEE